MRYEIVHYTEEEGSEVVHILDGSAYEAEDYVAQYIADLTDEMDETTIAVREGENVWNLYDDAGFQHTVYFR